MTDLAKTVLKTGGKKEPVGLALEKEEFNQSHSSTWVEDAEALNCSGCNAAFGIARRRHHCRECGRIFCSNCSKYKVVVGGRVRRACLACYKSVVEQSQASVKAQIQITSGSEEHRGTIAQNLAVRSSSSPNKKTLKSRNETDDDIYGRLSFGGSKAAGYTPTDSDRVSVDMKRSSLEQSFMSAGPEVLGVLSPWVHAILFIRTDESLCPVLEASVPSGRISDPTLATILDHSMSEILDPADGYPKAPKAPAPSDLLESDMIEYNYTYRVRCCGDDDVSELESDNYLNCYVAFREVMSPATKAMKRQSLVLVTRWPFPHFAYRLLGKIEEALWHVFTIGAPVAVESTVAEDVADNRAKASRASQALHTAYGQFLSWPPPVADTPMSLPFFGEILQLTLPSSMFMQHPVQTPMAAALASTAGGRKDSFSGPAPRARLAPVYAQSNLISVFGPLGLVPHLWGFWELLMTGRDIVVVAERPSLCSEVVVALSTLTHPAGFVGEIWPFVSARGNLADEIGRTLKEKLNVTEAQSKTKLSGKKWNQQEHMDVLRSEKFSAIIGITNPLLLKKFDGVAAVIFASPSPTAWFGLERYSSRLSASMRVYDENQTFSEKRTADNNLSCSDFYMSSYRLWSRGIQRVLTGIDKREVTTLFAVQEEPSSAEQQRITKRLRRLSKSDYLALGSILLRDHFSELTRAFHKPLEGSVSTVPPVALPVEAAVTSEVPSVQANQSMREKLKEERPLLTDKELRREKARAWLNHTYAWLQDNRPTAIMHAIIAVSIVTYLFLGLPIILIVVGIYFMQIPEKAPEGVEIMLQAVFPKTFLYPNKYKPTPPPASSSATTQTKASTVVNSVNTTVAAGAGVKDFSGIWKRVKTVNFDTFAGAQGATFVQRKLAASMPMTHTITMNPPDCDMIRLQEKGGPLETDRLFTIGGDPVELTSGKKQYLDQFYWSPTEPGVLVLKKILLPDKGSEMVCKRYLEGNTIRATFVYREYASGKEVEASAFFERVGDSPNLPPESTNKKTAPGAADSVVSGNAAGGRTGNDSSLQKRVNLSGVWTVARRVNVEAYVGAQGAGYVQRKLAANAPMQHTITTDEGVANFVGFRIQEKAGPIDSDTTYFANGMQTTRTIVKKVFKESLTWEDDALVLRRVHEAGDFELVLTRRLEDGSDGCPELVLTSLHRDLITGKETVATLTWTKTGPSPNPAVVVPPEVLAGAAVAEGARSPSAKGENPSEADDESDDGDDEIVVPSASKSSFPRALSTAPRADMTGVWKRFDTLNYDAFVAAQGAGYIQRKLAASMDLQHTIILDPPIFSEFTLQEKGGPLNTNLHYHIGDENPVENYILKKRFLDICYWEGDALVVRRRHDAGDFELIFRRHLERKDGSPVIRLVAIHRNIKTGDETESISFFRKIGEPESSPSEAAVGGGASTKRVDFDK